MLYSYVSMRVRVFNELSVFSLFLKLSENSKKKITVEQ